MAHVGKALRFQILRRDSFACHYCGAPAAPGTPLTVDHVIPDSLAGPTTPENLVTACQPCNSGKASAPPDSGTLASVRADALRWGRAMRFAAEEQAKQRHEGEAYVQAFDAEWNTWTYTSDKTPVARDETWELSILRFHAAGLELNILLSFISRAMRAKIHGQNGVWKYLCGMCWRILRERVELAQSLLAASGREV